MGSIYDCRSAQVFRNETVVKASSIIKGFLKLVELFREADDGGLL